MFRLPSGKSNINGRMCRPLGVAYAIRFADIPPGLFEGRTDGGRWEITTSEAGVAPASVLARP